MGYYKQKKSKKKKVRLIVLLVLFFVSIPIILGAFWSTRHRSVNSFATFLNTWRIAVKLYMPGLYLSEFRTRQTIDGTIKMLKAAQASDYISIGIVWIVIFFRFFRKKYGRKCKTLKGEKVKSVFEKRTADKLFQCGIRYKYEPKIRDWWIFGRVVALSDFYLKDYNVYIENWGLDHIKRGYRKHMEEKKEIYRKKRMKLISLYYSRDGKYVEQALVREFEAVVGQRFPGKV